MLPSRSSTSPLTFSTIATSILLLVTLLSSPVTADKGGFQLRRTSQQVRQHNQNHNHNHNKRLAPSTLFNNAGDEAEEDSFQPGSSESETFSPNQLATIASQSLKVLDRYGNSSDPSVRARKSELRKEWRWAVDLLQGGLLDIAANMERKGATGGEVGVPAEQRRVVKEKLQQRKTSNKGKSAVSLSSKGGVYHVPLEVELNADGFQLEPNAWFKIGGDRYLLTVDSGSTIPWIKGEKFPGGKSQHLVHAPQGELSTYGFSLKYGAGEVQGDFHDVDSMALGDVQIDHLLVGSASQISDNFKEDVSDGVMGFGFRELNSDQIDAGPSFLDRLFKTGKPNAMKEDIVCLAMQADARKSSLQFGGTDRALYKGRMRWFPINHVGFWQLNIDSLAMSRDRSGGIKDMDLIIDSGTSLIVAGQRGARAFWAGVAGAKYHKKYEIYTFPCAANLEAHLRIQRTTYRLTQDQLSLGPMRAGSDMCIGTVGAMDTQDVVVWGLAGMRSMYTCLNHATRKVGIADPTW